jgi:hypothetical protein
MNELEKLRGDLLIQNPKLRDSDLIIMISKMIKDEPQN